MNRSFKYHASLSLSLPECVIVGNFYGHAAVFFEVRRHCVALALSTGRVEARGGGEGDVMVDELPHQSKQHIVAVHVVLVVPNGQCITYRPSEWKRLFC